MKPVENTCVAIEQNLSLFVGGDLDAATMRIVEGHLAICDPCTRRAVGARHAREVLVSGLRSRETKTVDLWPGVRAALAREGVVTGRGQAPVRSIRSGWSIRRVASLAAAAVVLGFFVQNVWMNSGEAPPAGPSRPIVSPEIVEVLKQDPIQTTPVAVAERPSGLRRLAPGEARLIESAEVYDPQSSGFLLRQGGNPNMGSPASLQTGRRVH